jgi:CheY-like chemotaxis protein
MDPKTVLCVDDEAHILQVVSLKLQNAGYNVLTAPDAEEALDVAQGTAIDLMITDLNMPGKNGVELAEAFHADPSRKHVPVILLTAHGLTLDPLLLVQAGINAVLSKPFSPREVLQKVNTLLVDSSTVGSVPAV